MFNVIVELRTLKKNVIIRWPVTGLQWNCTFAWWTIDVHIEPLQMQSLANFIKYIRKIMWPKMNCPCMKANICSENLHNFISGISPSLCFNYTPALTLAVANLNVSVGWFFVHACWVNIGHIILLHWLEWCKLWINDSIFGWKYVGNEKHWGKNYHLNSKLRVNHT